MEINSNNPPTPPPSAAQFKATAQTLQVGQMLRAVVVETVQNSVKLQINDTLVQAPTTRQHAAGETLLLTVMRAGDKPVFRVHSQLSAAATPQVTQENALKVALPKQMPLTLLLANLNAATQLKSQLAASLPLEVSASIKKLLNSLADTQQIKDPAILKRAITDSGLLLEQKLSKFLPQRNVSVQSSTAMPSQSSSATTPLLQDFKGNLLQLLGTLKQSATTGNLPTRQSPLPQPLQAPLPTQGTTPPPLNNNGAQSLQQALQLALKENASRTLSRTETAPPTVSDAETTQIASRLRELPATLSAKLAQFPFLRQMPLVAQKRQQATLPLMQFREQIIDELIRQIEGSLSRIQLSQLASLPQESAPQQPSWTFELPLRDGENLNVVQMRIEREEPQEGDEQEPRWRVSLTLDLEEIGTLYAQIAVQGENSTTSLWAEEPETVTLIEKNLDLLRGAIEQHGINAAEICCQHGAPPQPLRPQRHTLLVDTQV